MSEMLEGFIRALEAVGSKVQRRGESAVAQCPAHDDNTASLSFSMGDDGIMFTCHAGCKKPEILEAAKLSWKQVFKNGGKREKGSQDEDLWMPCRKDGCDGHKVAEYLYDDEQGELLYAVARCSRKGDGCQGFRQWVPDPDAKYGKRWKVTADVRRVVYGLRKVIEAARAGRRIYLMEGEKDAERLMADYPGEVATTIAQGGGTGKWKPEFCAFFQGASEVIIVADCDTTGLRYAEEVHRHMSRVVTKVKVVCPTLLDEGADFSDHRDYGFGLDTLMVVPFEPVKKRPRMVIEIEEVDREKEPPFTGFGQGAVERSLIGSMLKDGNAYSISPIDITTDDKLKVITKAVARLANRGRTVSPEVVALELEEGTSVSYDEILTELLGIEKVAFSDTEKPKVAARILRQRTIRRHMAAWLNAAIRRLGNETVDLQDIINEMRAAFARHAQEYVDLNVYCEPVGDVFSGDVIEEIILEETEGGSVSSVTAKVQPKQKSASVAGPQEAKGNVRPIRREVVYRPKQASGQGG